MRIERGCLSFLYSLYSEKKARRELVDYFIFGPAKNVTAQLQRNLNR